MIGQSLAIPTWVSDLSYIPLYRNHMPSNQTPNLGQIWHFWPFPVGESLANVWDKTKINLLCSMWMFSISDIPYCSSWKPECVKCDSVTNRVQISHFLTSCKIWRGVGEIYETILRVQPRTKPPIYFCWCAVRPRRGLESWWQRSTAADWGLRHTSSGLNRFTLAERKHAHGAMELCVDESSVTGSCLYWTAVFCDCVTNSHS